MNLRDDASASLFQRLLGNAFAQLAPAVQRGHQPGEVLLMSGQASVRRGSGLLARALCRVIGFPAAGDAVPVSVHMQTQGAGERWQRRFGAQRFESHFSLGQGPQQGLLVEQFGPLRFHISLAVVDGALLWAVRSGALWIIPLPALLLPSGDSREYESEGRFHFDVEIAHPLAGLLVQYRGWLEPAAL
ncbi:DUF4166 domain-containing protein [Rhodoferax saidenbachensis]|uniref:DUF4166 domain-containing protein n=1 Tax=Rhodoferax saidenbachensis TaxID=1484693 RepID=A0ABU1ZP61_9BURK|nr:DUF4166 domain-containing protein [Rhodoferax saidenbachensis]MDR7307327.1 hypothetical protein [Rhodoferax saidenbachensis]